MKNFNKSKFIGGKVAMWIAVIVVVGTALFGIVKLASKQQDPGTNGTGGSASAISSVLPNDHKKGNANASITLIEYSDFQCPACGAYFPLVKKLGEDFGDNLQIVYRHFPLPQHKNAKLAAVVSEAAAKQGKFWEMHDMIFENQSEWSESSKADEIFLGYIGQLGINLEQFSQDLGASDLQKKVDDSYINGIKIGLNSTPTFFLSGEKLVNPRNYEEFRALITQKINEGSSQTQNGSEENL